MALYHYCANDVLLSLATSRELWMSDLSLSNDATEGQWVRHVFVEYCKKADTQQTTIDRLVPYLDWILTAIGAVGFCLSEEGDLLSQWRGYANGGSGVSVGFNKNYLDKLCQRHDDDSPLFKLAQVEYRESSQVAAVAGPADDILKAAKDGALCGPSLLDDEDDVKRRTESLYKMRTAFLHFFPLLFTMKNPAFNEEKEWRLTSVFLKSTGEDELGEMPTLEFRATSDRFIPCRKVKLPDFGICPIEEVILGPKNITPEHIVRAMLAHYGMPKVVVRRSAATYR